ncbi:fatty acid amide hydrolase-like isoform X2 [Brachypodium distachyon]|uniref:fatty acid amide hydrolase-like isoform X2 n=1 Tax=Brachypodium distachyon TaxID=15368 RepID=UPI000D0DD1EB|nr:fatty acid amide hydrolase-like isoform X2 [Brachypodium distachyon]|eukprot:XP_024310691.1 fatty acid amide hydrolase-like isoform X2 [Brachypodium distachyon]
MTRCAVVDKESSTLESKQSFPLLKTVFGFISFAPFCSSNSAPRVAGLPVKLFAWVLDAPVVGAAVLHVLKRENLINKLVSDAEIPEPPLFAPAHTCQDQKVQINLIARSIRSPSKYGHRPLPRSFTN